MRLHVVLTPAELEGARVASERVVVIDVFRAGTTIATALSSGCRAVLPALTPDEAWLRAREFRRDEVLLAGERGGEPIEGFDLGNSPLEYAPERVTGKVIILTTTNGTRALVGASKAAAVAVAALVNVKAVAQWAQAETRDVTLACAGEAGETSLEDVVCAGLIVEQIVAGGRSWELSDAAALVRGAAREYRHRLDDLRAESRWGRHLLRRERHRDLDACLALDGCPVLPLFRDGLVTVAQP